MDLDNGNDVGEGVVSTEDTEVECIDGNYLNSRQNKDSNNDKIYNHPMRQITSKFDKDIKAPYRATKDIEAKIKLIKGQLAQPINKIKETKIKKNFKKSEIESIKKIKEHNDAAIYFTDKTNKIAIMDKKLVDEKTLDHLRSSKFKELNYDPSPEIERKGKKLLDEISEDPDIDIPPVYFKQGLVMKKILLESN